MNHVCSVIIPAFNSEKCIAEAIDSVLSQECDFDFEIIVVDDGSTDRTADTVRRYSDKVRFIQKENGGPGSARNVGVREARAEIIVFLDADDRMLPGRLAHQAGFMLAHPEIAMTFGNLEYDDGLSDVKQRNGFLSNTENFENLNKAYQLLITEGGCVGGSTMAVRRNLFLSKGMMREDIYVAEDYDYACRISIGHPIAYTGKRLIWCRRNGHQNLMNSQHTYYGPVRVLYENLLAHADLLSREELKKALVRFRELAWALLRHEWAFNGRSAAMKRIDEFERLLPARTALFWRAASLCPPAVGRLSRRALHILRNQSDNRWVV